MRLLLVYDSVKTSLPPISLRGSYTYSNTICTNCKSYT